MCSEKYFPLSMKIQQDTNLLLQIEHELANKLCGQLHNKYTTFVRIHRSFWIVNITVKCKFAEIGVLFYFLLVIKLSVILICDVTKLPLLSIVECFFLIKCKRIFIWNKCKCLNNKKEFPKFITQCTVAKNKSSS